MLIFIATLALQTTLRCPVFSDNILTRNAVKIVGSWGFAPDRLEELTAFHKPGYGSGEVRGTGREEKGRSMSSPHPH